MDATSLISWRTRYDVSQQTLANLLHVHRKTVNNWETRRTPCPVNLHHQLRQLQVVGAVERAPKLNPLPTYVTPASAELRLDLKLYELCGGLRGRFQQGPEHPCKLLDITGKVAWSVLESTDYIQALAAHRGEPFKRISDLPTASQQQPATLNLPSRATKPAP